MKNKNNIILITICILAFIIFAFLGWTFGSKLSISINNESESQNTETTNENTTITSEETSTLPKWAEYLLSQEITSITISNRTCAVDEDGQHESSEIITKDTLEKIISKMTESKLIKYYYDGFGGPCLTNIVVKYDDQELTLFLFQYIKTSDEKIKKYLEESTYEIKKAYPEQASDSDYMFMYDWDKTYIDELLK